MDLILYRFTSDRDTSLGLLFLEDAWECFTLEDEYRVTKVAGKTRIPAGRYRVDLLREETPLTLKYREKYPWFGFHLELKDVPEFDRVYIHIGNWHTNTRACILVGSSCDSKGAPDSVGNSTATFKLLYMKLKPRLEAGEEIWLRIIDEPNRSPEEWDVA